MRIHYQQLCVQIGLHSWQKISSDILACQRITGKELRGIENARSKGNQSFPIGGRQEIGDKVAIVAPLMEHIEIVLDSSTFSTFLFLHHVWTLELVRTPRSTFRDVCQVECIVSRFYVHLCICATPRSCNFFHCYYLFILFNSK